MKPLSLVLAAVVLFTACSKKEQTAAKPSSAPATAPAAAEAEKDAPAIRFNLPTAAQPTNTTSSVSPSLPPSTPSVPQTDKDGIESPQVVEYYPPFYPLSLRMQGIEGQVIVQIDIDEKGDVVRTSAVGTSAPQFNDFALTATRQWKLTPARKNGTPIPISFQIRVDFLSEFGSRQMNPESPLAALTYVDGKFYSLSKEGRLMPANAPVTPLVSFLPAFDTKKLGDKELRAVVTATINEEGQVLDPAVTTSSGTDFDQVAVKAMRFWQFVPEIKDGKPVAKKVTKPFVISGKDKAN